MFNIDNKVFQKSLMYDGKVMLKYKIEFPQIKGYDKFNIINYTQALELQKKCEENLYQDAKNLYEYNKQNNYPFFPFEVVSGYLITYNYDDTISLYYDEYIYSGGAHGNTLRTSQTWKMKEQTLIDLADYFPKEPNYVSKIIEDINLQIEQNIKNGNNYYFENYCCLTSSKFRVENFYISNGNIIIYYQQYDIAPYSSGILNFLTDI